MKADRRMLSGGLACLALLACGGTTQSPPSEIKPKVEKGSEKPIDPRYAELPTPGKTPIYAPPTVTKTTLTNGLSLWHMREEKAPLVSIHLMLPTGGATDPVGKEGLSLLTADMLDEGAGNLGALELSDRLGELATDYSSTGGVDYVLLSMEALSENLEESLSLLSDMVMRPKLSKDEFDRRKKHHLATALAEQDDPSSSRSNAVSHALFGDGYAGTPPTGTHSSLDAITYADMKRHAAAMTVPEGAHLTIAGMSDYDAALSIVEKVFGKWKGKLEQNERELVEQEHSGKAFVINHDEAAQSALAVITGAGSSADPNYFAEEVMNDKLGQSFTSRINMNLREDKGYTYGAASIFQRYEKTGYFGVYTNVKSEATGASIKEILAELSAVCGQRPLSDKERNEAVEGLLLGYPMQFDEVSALGMRLVTLPARGRPADFWQTWPENIKSISTARANEAAKPYCDPTQYSVVVAGDLDLVAPELAKMGLSVIEMDRNGHVVEKAEETQD